MIGNVAWAFGVFRVGRIVIHGLAVGDTDQVDAKRPGLVP